MEKATTPKVINCPQHVSQTIQRVDPELSAPKNLYCFECMLESDDPKKLHLNLPTLPVFFATTQLSFENSTPNPSSGIPNEYLSRFNARTETIQKLRRHLEKEKEQVVGFFNEVAKDILEMMEQMKAEVMEMLDKQLYNLKEHYSFFEKELMKGYLEPKHTELKFHNVDDLKKRMELVEDSVQLNQLIKDIKKDLSERVLNIHYQSEEKKKWYFNDLAKNLAKMETFFPMFEGKDTSIHMIRDEIKTSIHHLLETVFVLKDPISDPYATPDISDLPSTIIGPKDFLALKEWVPSKYGFSPKLIYRGTRDGLDPKAFHTKCDSKGPTITLIKCQLAKSSQVVVIGGFLDQCWHQDKNGTYIVSNDAFIFSLTNKTKYDIARPHCAAYGCAEQGPTFGGFDICITKDMDKCYTRPYSYANSCKLLFPENGDKSVIHYFATKEIEVYTLF